MSGRLLGGVALAGALAGALTACRARPRTWSPPPAVIEASGVLTGGSSSPGEIAEIDLRAGAPESASATSLLSGSSHATFFQLVSTVKATVTEKGSHGLFVRFGGARLGWARAQELAGLLAAVRAAKKPVVCHADGYTNTSAWAALAGCDRIWVSPAGGVDTIGIAAQVVYANRLLTKKLGVEVDMLQVGRFKGAEEPLTREGPSPEARASLESALGEIRKEWLAGFQEARGGAAAEAAEDGPFSPDEAKQRGLVDAVGYADEARDEAKKLAKVERFDVRFGPSASEGAGGGLPAIVRALTGGATGRTGAPHVAVVPAVGAIGMDGGGVIPGEQAGITERRLGRTIRRLAEDASTHAVVLRINSPGGSALASDLLWHELMKLRAKKPIVVSIGDMAASGGYYLASTGNKIVAEPTSIVGSIGVVGGKLSIGNALESLGVHVETFSAKGSDNAAAGTRAAYESPLVAWDDATRTRVLASMTAVYDLFLRRVAEGRGLPVERIAESAEGRIFAGAPAKERGLVDEWGGIDRALALARELGKLPDDAPAVVVGQPSVLWELLGAEGDDGNEDENRARNAPIRAAAAAAAPFATGPMADAAGAIDAAAPELFAFLGSMLPLERGERTLAATPFAILVR